MTRIVPPNGTPDLCYTMDFKSNISKEERAAIRSVGKDKTIIILPADNGKATVIMDMEEYQKKVKDMLGDEKTYTKLNSDPTPKYRKNLLSILDRIKSEDKITAKQYQHLNPSSENQNTPRMYCTPKIHKAGNPLRPIVVTQDPLATMFHKLWQNFWLLW